MKRGKERSPKRGPKPTERLGAVKKHSPVQRLCSWQVHSMIRSGRQLQGKKRAKKQPYFMAARVAGRLESVGMTAQVPLGERAHVHNVVPFPP